MSSGSCVNDIEQYKYKFSDLQIGYLWPGQVPDFTIIQQLLRSVLLKTQGFVDSVPDTWQHIFFSEGSTPYFPHYRFEDASYQRIWFSVIALMSRLGMPSTILPLVFAILCSSLNIGLMTNDDVRIRDCVFPYVRNSASYWLRIDSRDAGIVGGGNG